MAAAAMIGVLRSTACELWDPRAQLVPHAGIVSRSDAHGRGPLRGLSAAADLGACTTDPPRLVAAAPVSPSAHRTLALRRTAPCATDVERLLVQVTIL